MELQPRSHTTSRTQTEIELIRIMLNEAKDVVNEKKRLGIKKPTYFRLKEE